jgi:DNA-binding CsgD family transcriptional regulator
MSFDTHAAGRTAGTIRRLCRQNLESASFRTRVVDALAPLIPFEAVTFATTDPDTGLLTHAVSRDVPEAVRELWIRHLYPYQVAVEILDMARDGVSATRSMSAVSRDLLAPQGFGRDLRAVLASDQHPWGFLCLLREPSSPDFSEEEVGFLRQLAPDLTRGLRSAWLRERRDPEAADVGPVGIVVVDGRGRIRTRNSEATGFLTDLADVGNDPDGLPQAVGSAVAHLRWHRARDLEASDPPPGRVRVRGSSGSWYRITASPADPPGPDDQVIVLLERAGPAEVASVLARLYGLTPREREVAALAARGYSTKAMARQLQISPWTVQEHLGNACSRVGVRTRKSLVAKLFLDGYADALAV